MREMCRLLRTPTMVVAALALGAGGMEVVAQKGAAIPADPDDRTIVHVLNRLGFGPAPGDIAHVRQIGLARYIEQQLEPERLTDADLAARLAGFATLTKSTRQLAEDYYVPALMARRQQQRQQASGESPPAGDPASRREKMTPEQLDAIRGDRQVLAELSQQKILRGVYSERQLYEVMVDFWFNHFNVFAGKGPTRLYLTEYERDAIRPHALGSFRDLLQATAESPAMLFYLDNWQSAAPPGAQTASTTNRRMPVRPGTRRQPDAFGRPRTPAATRPVAQNRRTRGLNENYARELMELHTLGVDGGYTQNDVQEVARAFTGWTIAGPRQGGSFRFEPRLHDDGEKVVLGHRIKAGGGQKDGEAVLDILATHPSTATFIATKLARRFVSDEPPPALVLRAARRFRDTRGNIREVVRTIVTSPEFFAAEAYRAKVKTPFEFVVSALRATGTDTTNALPMVQTLRTLGMPLYMCQPPTGYSDKAEAWVNTGALLNRMNFAVALAAGHVRGGRGLPPVSPAATLTSGTLVTSALAGDISDTTAATVARASANTQALALVLGSPEFQRR